MKTIIKKVVIEVKYKINQSNLSSKGIPNNDNNEIYLLCKILYKSLTLMF